ncbi:MAG: hypothetical protein DRO89_00175 [Candidatus Altiarchaeales archaeon]|nr:MAG: hypothetical protein DRO89_00175 [Candidatus Altiarchaeales archaeon]
MKELISELDVHIVPIGLEIDRAVMPLKKLNADKVYLLTQEKENGASRYFLTEIRKRIEGDCPHLKGGIIIEKYEEWNDLSGIMSKICEIVRYERLQGNRVFINISSGGKLTGIAGAIISLMYDVRAYYVIPEVYNDRERREPLTTGYRTTLELPKFRIEKPDDRLVYVLWIINKYGRTTQKKIVEELIDKGLMRSIGENGKELSKHALYGIFWRNFLRPIEEKGWIKREGQRRSAKVHLTEEGKNVLRIFRSSNKLISPALSVSAQQV